MSDAKAPYWIVPIILLLGVGALYVEGARHPAALPRWSAPPIVESKPRPKITAIPRDDPAVLAFSKFAKDHQVGWRIEPGLSGTTYCALLLERPYGFALSVDCEDTTGGATKRAIDAYELQKLGIGSK